MTVDCTNLWWIATGVALVIFVFVFALLPKSGWPVIDKKPPIWSVPIFFVFSTILVVLLVRLGSNLFLRGSVDNISKLMLALGGLLGAPFLVWRTWIADQQRHVAREDLYTGLLVKAIEQLGATREEKKSCEVPDGEGKTKTETITATVPNTELRLGAIYALEKLSRDYEPRHRQIMEILCAYVRENAGPARPLSDEIRAIYAKRRWDGTDDDTVAVKRRITELQQPCVDVQAALTVMGRRSEKQREFEKRIGSEDAGAGGFHLDLCGCDLTGINLLGLRFEDADFSGSCLENALLNSAHLEGAMLHNANLEGAMLWGAHLERATLRRAHFEGAVLTNAHLESAMLSYAHLEGARLDNAHLEHAALGEAHLENAYLTFIETFTQGQLDSAYGDESTKLPNGLSRPVNQRWHRASNPLDARSG